MTGSLLGVFVVLSVFALALFAIIQAYRRPTKKWIAAACAGALVVFITWTVVVLGVGMSAYRLSQKTVPPPAFPDSEIPHTLPGWRVAYKIVLPPGWTPSWSNPDFDMLAERNGLCLGVVAGPSVGSSTTIERMTRDKIISAAGESHLSDGLTVQIDGHPWREFEARLRVAPNLSEGQYQYDVYSGNEGMFQLFGWRTGPFQGDDLAVFRRFAASFRFPAATPITTLAEQTVRGTDRPYQLTIPPGWTVERSARSFDVIGYHSPVSVGVIAADKRMGTQDEVVRYAQTNLREFTDGLQLGEISPVKIDGRPWQRFTAKGREKGVVFQQETYVYVGPEGAFRIIARVRGQWGDADESALREVALSFRFSPAP